jgi:hypothetical protein
MGTLLLIRILPCKCYTVINATVDEHGSDPGHPFQTVGLAAERGQLEASLLYQFSQEVIIIPADPRLVIPPNDIHKPFFIVVFCRIDSISTSYDGEK